MVMTDRKLTQVTSLVAVDLIFLSAELLLRLLFRIDLGAPGRHFMGLKL
jgi:hypothetical protein